MAGVVVDKAVNRGSSFPFTFLDVGCAGRNLVRGRLLALEDDVAEWLLGVVVKVCGVSGDCGNSRN